MAHIKIESFTDDWYSVTGFDVSIDGVPFGEYEPIVNYYGETSYELETVLKDLLEYFGHTVEEV